jgi:acyl-CoA synthetase (AMP-forming)/AMP-acid ligase II
MFFGRTVVTIPKFEPKPFLEAIQKYQIPELIITPSVVLMLATNKLVDDYNLSSIRYGELGLLLAAVIMEMSRFITCGAAPLGQDLIKRFIARFPAVKLRQLYGMTEIMVATIGRFDDFVPGSVGRVVPETTVKIVCTDTGKICGPQEKGELFVKTKTVANRFLGTTNVCLNLSFIGHEGIHKQ